MVYFQCTCGFPLTAWGDDILTCPVCDTPYNPFFIRAKIKEKRKQEEMYVSNINRSQQAVLRQN